MNQILSMNQEPRKYEREEAYQKNNQTAIKTASQLQSIQRANMTSNKADLSKVIKI